VCADRGADPPALNGHCTLTPGQLPGSPAPVAGNTGGFRDGLGALIPTDQRGFVPPFGPRCDIGAYELAPLRVFLPWITR
jgi:hypothetical protein